MKNSNNKTPNLKNSQAVGKGERQKVKNNMNAPQNSSQINFTSSLGNVPNLTSSNAVGNAEKEKVKRKIRESQNKNPNNTGLR